MKILRYRQIARSLDVVLVLLLGVLSVGCLHYRKEITIGQIKSLDSLIHTFQVNLRGENYLWLVRLSTSQLSEDASRLRMVIKIKNTSREGLRVQYFERPDAVLVPSEEIVAFDGTLGEFYQMSGSWNGLTCHVSEGKLCFVLSFEFEKKASLPEPITVFALTQDHL